MAMFILSLIGIFVSVFSIYFRERKNSSLSVPMLYGGFLCVAIAGLLTH